MDGKIKYAVLLAIMCMMRLPAYGVDEYHRAALNLGYTEAGYHLALTYHYRIWDYVGIGGSIGYWSDDAVGVISDVLNVLSYDPDYTYDYYYDYGRRDRDDDRQISVFIEPSILLTTPRLRIGSCGLGLMAMPSVRFGTNRYNSDAYWENGQLKGIRYKCSNMHFGVQGGLTLYVAPLSFTVGYMAQLGDIRRIYISRNHYGHHSVQGFFLELGAYF